MSELVKLRHRGMSASRQLYHREPTFDCAAISDALGHERPVALQENSETFRRRSTMKWVTDLPIGP